MPKRLLKNVKIAVENTDIEFVQNRNMNNPETATVCCNQDLFHLITNPFATTRSQTKEEDVEDNLWMSVTVVPIASQTDRIMLKLLVSKLNSFLFTKLRTGEHLGYVVDASDWPFPPSHALVMIRIESPDVPVDEIDVRVQSALENFLEQEIGDGDSWTSLVEAAGARLMARLDDADSVGVVMFRKPAL
eukprot:Gregarina_sp_Poly_1__5288@NODE_279_length_10190_cov_93_504495_g243_i0_p7_GENE_NODE_279_length_10190_cov_93_504495_g243_i0NODE_279_length_10190_cov_93_504495_g243_i0_p7_ORF_typecomplete_len189_score23_84Peptidase_M16_C/PF05193_21/0_0014_NODE_279_length_10190_cov_93_504495_g243_i070027568